MGSNVARRYASWCFIRNLLLQEKVRCFKACAAFCVLLREAHKR